jgi:histidinol-phosphate aminotransferase
MAGLRLGLAAAHPERLRELASPGDNPLPVPAAGGRHSLQDPGADRSVACRMPRRARATIAGWASVVSAAAVEANCFVVDATRRRIVAKAMADNGVVIGRSWPIWPQSTRVTVGSEDEMAAFRRAFAKVPAYRRRPHPRMAWTDVVGATVGRVGADRWSARHGAHQRGVLVSGGAWCWRS